MVPRTVAAPPVLSAYAPPAIVFLQLEHFQMPTTTRDTESCEEAHARRRISSKHREDRPAEHYAPHLQRPRRPQAAPRCAAAGPAPSRGLPRRPALPRRRPPPRPAALLQCGSRARYKAGSGAELTLPQKTQLNRACCETSIFLICLRIDAPYRVPNFPVIPTFFVCFPISAPCAADAAPGQIQRRFAPAWESGRWKQEQARNAAWCEVGGIVGGTRGERGEWREGGRYVGT